MTAKTPANVDLIPDEPTPDLIPDEAEPVDNEATDEAQATDGAEDEPTDGATLTWPQGSALRLVKPSDSQKSVSLRLMARGLRKDGKAAKSVSIGRSTFDWLMALFSHDDEGAPILTVPALHARRDAVLRAGTLTLPRSTRAHNPDKDFDVVAYLTPTLTADATEGEPTVENTSDAS